MGKVREGVNRVMLVGKVAAEPRSHWAGKSHWLHLTLITEETVRGQKKTFTHEEQHHICTSGQELCLEDLAIKKGDTIFVQGRLSTHAFTDAEGIKRYKTEVMADSIEHL